MIKVMVIEDEGLAARRLIKMIEAADCDVIKHTKSIAETLKYLEKHEEPDLYLMDIHLSDGIVFELFQSRELYAPIIFTTAFDQYAIKAFKQNSIDYLLKPIDEDELNQAIDKFQKLHSPKGKKNKESNIDLEVISALLHKSNAAPNFKERIRIKIGDHFKSLSIREITHFYSEEKISFCQTADGRNYPIDYSIEAIFNELNPNQFHRVSRSYIVNIDYIDDVISYSNSRLKVNVRGAGNKEIIVARDRAKAFKNWLG